MRRPRPPSPVRALHRSRSNGEPSTDRGLRRARLRHRGAAEYRRLQEGAALGGQHHLHRRAFDFFYRPVPQQGQGSGFILDKEGHILTNNHVVDNAQRVEVTLSDKHKYKATVVGVDKSHDLALLQINAPNLQPATLAESQSLVVGQRVYAIGNPFGLSGTMTRGIISAIRSIRGPQGKPIEDAIQTDAAINPGNSGGPLLNSRGEVIGITTLIANNGAEQVAGIGFAIPINTAKAVMADFAKYGRVRRPRWTSSIAAHRAGRSQSRSGCRGLRHSDRACAAGRSGGEGRPARRHAARSTRATSPSCSAAT